MPTKMVTPPDVPSSISETSEIPSSSAGHSRNLSTVSSNTLHTTTNTTLYSTPYEPLLPPISQKSSHAYELVSRRSVPSPILSLVRWSQSNMRSKLSSPNINEKASNQENYHGSRKAQRLKPAKRVLEVVLVLWSVYSMGRYLFAFTIYESLTGQLATLFLGICSGLSFAFTTCSIILSFAQRHLLVRSFSVHALLAIRSTLQHLSTVCFLGPSIVNFILLAVWRDAVDAEIQFSRRCKLDLDLVWTITYSLCDNTSNSWGIWVALAVIRIVLSIIIIIAFHITSNSQVIVISNFHHVKGSKSHKRLHSDFPILKPSSSKAAEDPSSKEPVLLTTKRSLSNKSSPRHRLRYNQSRSSEGAAPGYNNQEFLSMGSETDPCFIEKFRSMISQVSRETDEGLAYARASYTSCQSQESADSPTCLDMDDETLHGTQYDACRHYDDDDDDFYAMSSRHEKHYTDDHQQQQQAEEQQIRVMNGYIKRMPTIESMGSRELLGSLGSSGVSSLNTNHDRNVPRPPTRNTLLSWNGTDISGSGDANVRRRSLTAQAELLVVMCEKYHSSEMGELVKPGETVKLVDRSGTMVQYDSSTSGSQTSAQTFHTAPNGGYLSDSLTSALAEATNTDMATENS